MWDAGGEESVSSMISTSTTATHCLVCGMIGYMTMTYYPKRDGRTTIHRGAYNSWRAMKERCYSKKYWARKHYAGKGITVCDRWLDEDGFANFLSDMGDRPEGHSLDRIDNDGDYCPENCRWSTQKEQVANSSKVINAKITASELETACCCPYTVYCRLKKGWSKEDALHTPIDKSSKLYGPCLICGKMFGKERRRSRCCCNEHSRMLVSQIASARKRGSDGTFI